MASRSTSNGSSTGPFVCPECGREFARASALGAHRKRSHGVAGTSRSSSAPSASRSRRRAGARTRATAAAATTKAVATTTRRSRTAAPRGRRKSASSASSRSRATPTQTRTQTQTQTQTGSSTHDALLRALFPNGVPARASVIAALGPWLAEADRLARMR
jgi:hypothetical protein